MAGGYVIVFDFSPFPGRFDFPFLFVGESPESYFSKRH